MLGSSGIAILFTEYLWVLKTGPPRNPAAFLAPRAVSRGRTVPCPLCVLNTSVNTPKAAIRERLKTGHTEPPGTG